MKGLYGELHKTIINYTKNDGLTLPEIYGAVAALEVDTRFMMQRANVKFFNEMDREKAIDQGGEPCPNCKETIRPCACLRNKCRKCGKPVGNITFTCCDECFEESKNSQTGPRHA